MKVEIVSVGAVELKVTLEGEDVARLQTEYNTLPTQSFPTIDKLVRLLVSER